MAYLFNVLYLLAIAVLSPWLGYKACTTGKYRRGLGTKLFGRVEALPETRGDGPRVWFHGVSVGEIHLLRGVVGACRRAHPEWELVISTTTDTGFDEARKIFADFPVVYWPLDFSWAVARALDAVRPDLVVLAESELWPNFLRAARARQVPVAVINARMSPRSAARFRRLGPLARALFGGVDVFGAQTGEYASHYLSLGAGRVVVTGSVKYDGAQSDRGNPRTCAMRQLLSIASDNVVWVAGSTQAPEEQICVDLYRKARELHPRLRLVLVPRQKDRFDEVARLLDRSGLPYVRRSQVATSTDAPIVLVDTIGELGAIWGLAEVAFVGGSLDGQRGGQNMIEPAAYGAAVVFGPHTWNFKDTVSRLLEGGAALQVPDAAHLESAVLQLLAAPEERSRLGAAARRFVQSQQGATERTLAVLASLLAARGAHRRAA